MTTPVSCVTSFKERRQLSELPSQSDATRLIRGIPAGLASKASKHETCHSVTFIVLVSSHQR